LRGYAGRIANLTYIGHATLLVELGGLRVLTDPLLRRRVLHIRRRVPLPEAGDLGSLDAILISHPHHDHLDPVSLRALDPACPVVAPRGCARILRHAGVRDAIEVEPGDRVEFGGSCVEAVEVLHDGRRYPFGRSRPALAYLLEGPPSLFFAGDTDLFPEMAALAGRVDIAALPVWGWGPDLPPGHLDPERAARAAALIEPRVAIPIHWGTMVAVGAQRGADPQAPPREFARAAARIAPNVEVSVLAPGERLEL
jgi:L-ascorbate metabolism protein UlaG (beta-lactamase superfamily)